MFPIPSAKTAIAYKERAISYEEFVRSIMACRAILEIAPGDRVAIVAENRPEWIIAFYAVWQRRGVAVAIDPSMPAEDMAAIFKDCQPKAVFCSAQTEAAVQETLRLAGVHAACTDLAVIDTLPPGEALLAESAPHDMDALAALVYTSGTTGEPKGAMLSYRNLNTSARAVRAGGFYQDDDTVLVLLPLFHVFPLQGSMVIPITYGCKLALAAGMQKEDIAAALTKEKCTHVIGVPRLYEMFHAGITEKVRASAAGRVLFALNRCIGSRRLGRILFSKVHNLLGPHVRVWICGGAKTNKSIMRDMQVLGFCITEGYGLTEAASLLSFNPIKKPRVGTAGIPASNMEVRIIDNEIALRGGNVMLGYYNKPEQTARMIRDGWLYTGDTGSIDSKGHLHVTGRRDELIVLPNGKKIDPEVIEKQICAMSPLIREIGVLQHNGQLAAVIYPCESLLAADILGALQTIKEEIIERYNDTVALYRRILQIHITTETLPRTRLGKMRRFMLQNFFDANREDAKATAQKDTITDDTLRALCEYLGRRKGMTAKPESRLDFDLTLDSLDRLELTSFIQTNFGRSLSEADIAQAGSITDVAALVHNAAPADENTFKEITARNIPQPRKHNRSILRPIIAFMVRHCFRYRTEGLELLPEDGPCILAANHESYLDIPCLVASLPKTYLSRSITWVKASPIMEKIVRFLTRGKNILVVHAKKPLSLTLRISERVLDAGHNLIIFPEGLRSRDGQLADFRPGFAILACKKKIPIIPIAIDGTYEIMPRGRLIPRFGRTIRFTVTEPIMPLEGESDTELAQRVHDRIAKVIAAQAAASRKS